MHTPTQLDIDMEKYATTIQASVRRFLSQSRYSIFTSEHSTLYGEELPAQGNDPTIVMEPLLDSKQSVLLLATSKLRAVELACCLKSSSRVKIIVIDNSFFVWGFWQNIKKEMLRYHDHADFLAGRRFRSNPCYYSDDTSYLLHLINTFGFKQIRNTIDNTLLLQQDWAQTTDFFKIIKNEYAIHYDRVIVYPSNIVEYLLDEKKPNDARQVLNNIELLNPELAIHTYTGISSASHEGKVFYINKNEHSHDFLEHLWKTEDPSHLTISSS